MKRRLFLVVAALSLLACDTAPSDTPLKTGDPAPDVLMALHDGSKVQLSSLRGKLVLVYFYPKDDTPG